MKIIEYDSICFGIRLSLQNEKNKEVGRAFLYIMRNNLHHQPFGLMEDVYIAREARGQGFGTLLVKRAIELAQTNNCYKLIATSRHAREKVHKLYTKIGFSNHGTEFRINF